MAIYGEMGEVESIGCLARPTINVVAEGELVASVNGSDDLADWVPENCPRKSSFDSTKPLGCLSCGNSLIDYDNGIIDC